MRPSRIVLSVFLGVVTMAVTTDGAFGTEPPAKLVENLGSEAYPQRVAAEKELQAWALHAGADARTSLLKLSKNSRNPEIRRRAFTVLKALVIKDLTDRRPGFVGIVMEPAKLPPEVNQEGLGVEVLAVSPGTPAEKADLRVSDVILKLDGKGWSQPEPQHEFANRIGAKRGGDKVKLEVLRGEKILELELVLVSRPWSAGTYNQTLRLRGMDPFAMPGQLFLDERSAEDQAFQEWLNDQKAMTPAR